MSLQDFLPPPPWEGPPIPRRLQRGPRGEIPYKPPVEVPFKETPNWLQQAWNEFEPGKRPRVHVNTGEVAKIGTPFHEGIVRRIVAHSSARGESRVKSVPGYESLMGSPKGEQRLYFGGEVELTPGNSIAVMDSMPGLSSISLYMHPDDFQPSAAIDPTLTTRQRKILATVRSFTSTYRRELFDRFRVLPSELDSLREMGFLDRRGAITIMGRNVSSDDQPFSPMEEPP